MGHRITINMPMPEAKKLQTMGRKFHGDNSLGIPQACYVLLDALATGEYRLAKVRKKQSTKPE